MPKHPRYTEIEAYLNGELSSGELTAFEKAMNEDERFSMEVDLQRLEHHAMDRMLEMDLKTKMKTWDSTPPPNPFDTKNNVPPPPERTNWIWWGIGGLLGVALLWYFMKPAESIELPEQIETETPEQIIPLEKESEETKQIEEEEEDAPIMAETKSNKPIEKKQTNKPQESVKKENPYRAIAMSQYEVPNNLSSNVRSGEVSPDQSAYDKAATAFSKKQYKDALDYLGEPSAEEESINSYLRGHIYFKLKNYNNAISSFQLVAENEWAPDALDAEWFLLLSYLAIGDKEKTKIDALTSKLAADDLSPYQEKAIKLLPAIQKMK